MGHDRLLCVNRLNADRDHRFCNATDCSIGGGENLLNLYEKIQREKDCLNYLLEMYLLDKSKGNYGKAAAWLENMKRSILEIERLEIEQEKEQQRKSIKVVNKIDNHKFVYEIILGKRNNRHG